MPEIKAGRWILECDQRLSDPAFARIKRELNKAIDSDRPIVVDAGARLRFEFTDYKGLLDDKNEIICDLIDLLYKGLVDGESIMPLLNRANKSVGRDLVPTKEEISIESLGSPVMDEMKRVERALQAPWARCTCHGFVQHGVCDCGGKG